ncbi:MAG: hypothetical protein EOM52_11100, partial [Clostridia bacterium]|nr:hypothetical protein [Clostridia bacterium]
MATMTAPARLTSRHHFNEKDKSGKNKKGALELIDYYYHEPGDLMIDAYVAYPEKAEMQIADYPESQPVNKRLRYEVRGDGKVLADGMFQAWILGRGKIDADVTGVKKLVLSTTRDWCARNSADTLFWGDAVLVTKNGKEIRLASLKPE